MYSMGVLLTIKLGSWISPMGAKREPDRLIFTFKCRIFNDHSGSHSIYGVRLHFLSPVVGTLQSIQLDISVSGSLGGVGTLPVIGLAPSASTRTLVEANPKSKTCLRLDMM